MIEKREGRYHIHQQVTHFRRIAQSGMLFLFLYTKQKDKKLHPIVVSRKKKQILKRCIVRTG